MQKLVDLTIKQDWNKVRQVFDTLNKKRLLGQLDSNKQDLDSIGMAQYDIGKFGSMSVDTGKIVGKSTYGNGWTEFSGPLLISLLPWTKQAKELFKNVGLISINWITIRASVNLHTDYMNFDDINAPYYVNSTDKKNQQCKLNYIVSSLDPDAVTISYDHHDTTKTWQTKSIPDTAFLLNPEYPHEVKNTGYREILTFLFNNDYKVVSEFFDRQGPIKFE